MPGAFRTFLVSLGLTFALTSAGTAQVASLNSFGMPGLIDMPTAGSTADAQLSTTIASFGGMTRNTLSFQITPRLSGSFRYTALQRCNCFGFSTYYDRSFDLHYLLLKEGRYRPAVAVGLRDFVGTGIYSGEYIAATKHLGRSLTVTGGIGWGRLGSYNSIRNPLSSLGSYFDTRPTGFLGRGGIPGLNEWFRGPAALFAGVEWQTPIPKLTFKAEYSSDAYKFEVRRGLIAHRSPFNFGLDYQVSRSLSLSGYYLYGNTLGLRVTLAQNPRRGLTGGSSEAAPLPVLRRPDDRPGLLARQDQSWTAQQGGGEILLENLKILLAPDDFIVEALAVTGTRAEVRVRNRKFGARAQAVGRVARAMTQVLPASVETLIVTPVEQGLPVASYTFRRSDLEELENDPEVAEKSFARLSLTGAKPMDGQIFRNRDIYPFVQWRIAPYLRYSLFDPQNPLRLETGLRAEGSVEFSPGFSASGSVIKRAFGSLHTISRVSNSVLPHVRSDFATYYKIGDPTLEYLTLDYLFKFSPTVYGRVSAGYLETMYGGLSAEVLWKPVNRRWALGAEVNLVRQRAFNQLFGFQPYQIATGHISGYYDFKNGFSAQVDVGRYLAGDWGTTFSIDRRFDNGWKVGAFATFTNVSFKRFGEGSFDKGFRITIPLSWATGQPSVKTNTATIRPVTRDGGAQLNIRNRLYPIISDYQRYRVEPTWERAWR